MPVHDWTRVEAGIFHDFHVSWIPEIRKALNSGILPNGFYALAEQHAGKRIADLLSLHASPVDDTTRTVLDFDGGIAVAEAPPRVRRKQSIDLEVLALRRTLAIRHVSGHRLIAIIEIVSPGNKDRAQHVEQFASKIVDALERGIHVLLIDLFPPGIHDPNGLHAEILHELQPTTETYESPVDEPVTLAAYEASGTSVESYVEHLTPGVQLPSMPLFLRPGRYIDAPLAPTYDAAYDGMPAFWRQVLEGR